MSTLEPRENNGRRLSTADLAAAARDRDVNRRAEDEPVSSNMQVDDVTDMPLPPTPSKSRRVESEQQSAESDQTVSPARPAEVLEPLFKPDLASKYRADWASIQSGFVDDPRQAVRDGDELVAQMMTDLANTFAGERHRVEAQLDETGEGATEDLRVALRRYRSFFERLLSL